MEIQRCSFNADQSSTSFLTEDLIVAEILPRLHVKALFRFKCVSVHYKSIISDPKFGKKYLQRANSSQESCSSSGLLPSLIFPFIHESEPAAFTPNVKDLCETMNSSSRRQYPSDECLFTASLSCNHIDHEIRGSSGGLQLSIAGPFFCVSNPVTKQCIQLPEPTKLKKAEVFGICTRSLTYKVLLMVDDCEYGPKTVEVFSSDTGSWVVWKVMVPGTLFSLLTPYVCYSYKGVLHWLDFRERSVITYNPYDTPHQTHSFRLPEGKYDGSLIYSGEEELLKYCQIRKCNGVKRLRVWSLTEGKWCLEGEFSVPSLKYSFERFMVAPFPWNRRVIYHPYVKSNTITVLNPWDGIWKLVKILKDSKNKNYILPSNYPFYPAELSPWSSPLYDAASPSH